MSCCHATKRFLLYFFIFKILTNSIVVLKPYFCKHHVFSLNDCLHLRYFDWSQVLCQPHYSFLFCIYVHSSSRKFKLTYVPFIICLNIFTFDVNIILFSVKIAFCFIKNGFLKNGMIQEGGWPLFPCFHGYHWQYFVFDFIMKAMKYVMWVVFESKHFFLSIHYSNQSWSSLLYENCYWTTFQVQIRALLA